MLTIGSLCSGACDGLSLGLEWAGLGPVAWQVEIEDARRNNLARHWPNANRSVADVTTASARNLQRVDLIVASSPCQDISSAGARAGITGPKSRLWFECLRIISELRPRFVVVENVASGARNWVPFVRSGLAGLGYTSLPIPVAAADCGAPHIRRRVFVLAYLDGDGELAGAIDAEMACTPPHVGHVGSESLRRKPTDSEQEEQETPVADQSRLHQGWPVELEVCTPPDGVSRRVVSALGDSVPQCAEVVGWVIRELIAERGAA